MSDKYEIIFSCALSYISNAFLEVICGDNQQSVFASVYGRVVSSTAILFICSVIVSIIIRTSWFDSLCSNWFGVSPKKDLFDGILDKKDGANIKVFLKSEKISVYGHYAGRDDDCAEPWIAISGPTIYTVGDKDQVFDKRVNFLVRISDIDHMLVD